VNKMRSFRAVTSALVLLVAFASASFAEISKNTHVYAMIEIDRFCRGDKKPTGQFTRVVVYHSSKGNYFTYMMSTAGQTFGPEGGSKRSTLDGAEMLSVLKFSGPNISYVEQGTQSSGNRTATATMAVEITADGSSCSVSSCSMEVVEAGRGSACQFRCYPEACEIRKGPAS
jgi:hypothetical protein